MPLILVLAFPRVVLVSTYIERAYHRLIIPLLGFTFLPFTTIVYALMVNNGLPISGRAWLPAPLTTVLRGSRLTPLPARFSDIPSFGRHSFLFR
jgi:hypothetical protein